MKSILKWLTTIEFCFLGLVILLLISCKSNQSEMGDIGCVIYTKNPNGSGNLIADWVFSPGDTNTIFGTGFSTKSPDSQDFEGEYIMYYTGKKTDSFSLIINQDVDIDSSIYYRVEWKELLTGMTIYYGTGIVKDKQLIVGWRK